MKIETVQAAEGVILRLAGEFDAPEREEATTAIDGLLKKGHNRFVFDLGGITILGSSGIECFVLARRRAEARGGGIAMAAAPPFVRKVLSTVGLCGDVPCLPTAEEAMRAIGKPPAPRGGGEEEEE